MSEIEHRCWTSESAYCCPRSTMGIRGIDAFDSSSLQSETSFCNRSTIEPIKFISFGLQLRICVATVGGCVPVSIYTSIVQIYMLCICIYIYVYIQSTTQTMWMRLRFIAEPINAEQKPVRGFEGGRHHPSLHHYSTSLITLSLSLSLPLPLSGLSMSAFLLRITAHLFVALLEAFFYLSILAAVLTVYSVYTTHVTRPMSNENGN